MTSVRPLLALVLSALSACGSFSDRPSPDPGPQDAGNDGAIPPITGVPVPDGCDPSADPKDAPKCVVNEFGVFVDAAGNDANAGTKESPVKSIGVALGKLGNKTRIYICEGTYEEHVKPASPLA